ncbi:MAG TPA: maleylacetoacetate isomerase [Polyangiaceae bacterium]|nr:maleylacetoacetate isomerase [Polyangiaceae bacterium]
MRLYGFWRSTATWRVRIALAHKGLAYEYRPVHLRRDGGEQNRDEFLALNPMRQVPVLEFEHEGQRVRLTQSIAILELLEELYPSPPLLPASALGRARARELAELVVSGIQPLQNTAVQRWVREALGADEAAWARHWVEKGLGALERRAAESAGRFLVGDALSFADLCLVPQLYFARRFAVDLAPYPTLTRVEAACAALPAFQQAHALAQPDAEG